MPKAKTEVKMGMDVSELNAAMREASRAISYANAEFKLATQGLKNWAESASGVKAKLSQLNDVLKAEEQKLQALKEKYRQTVETQGESSEQAERLAIAVKKQEAAVAKTQSELDKYTRELDELEGASEDASEGTDELGESLKEAGKAAEESESKLKKVASALGSGLWSAAKLAGKGIAALSAAAFTAGGMAVKSGMEFDSQMSTVKAISGATEEEFEKLTEKAKEMGSTTAFTATESGKALEYMAMAGWKSSEMLDGLPAVINTAAASGEDLADVSDIITDGITAFGLEAKDATHFSDVLAQASSNANTNIGMMGETFKYVAPLSGALKYTVDDVAVAIGLMANSGIKADQAGTSLRGVLSNLAAPSKKAADAMKELGLSLTDEDGNIKTFDETLSDLRSTFNGLTEAEKAEYATKIAGKNAMSGLLAMVNATDEEYQQLKISIEGADGAASRMAETKLDNLQGDVTLFKSALEGAKIAISDELSPALRTFVQEGTALIPQIQGDIASFGGELAGLATDLMPVAKEAVTAIMDLMRDAIGVIKDILPAIKDTIQALLPVAKEIISVIKSVIPPLSQIFKSLLPPAQKLITAILNVLKPILTKILPPLARLIEGLMKILTPIIEIVGKIVEVVSELVSLILGSVIGAIADFVDALLGLNDPYKKAYEDTRKLTDEEQALVDKTKDLTDAQKNMYEEMGNGLKSIEVETNLWETYAKNLDNCVDPQGKILEGKEAEAKLWNEKLGEALGKEYEIRGNQLQNYQKTKEEIYELIQAKKMEAEMSLLDDEYKKVKGREQETSSNYYDAQKKYNDAQKQLEELEQQYKALSSIPIFSGKFETLNVQNQKKELTGQIDALKDKINGDLLPTLRAAETAYSRDKSFLDSWGEAYEAMANKDLPKFEKAVLKASTGFITAENSNAQQLNLQIARKRLYYKELLELAQKEGSQVTTAEIENAKAAYEGSEEEFLKLQGIADKSTIDAIVKIKSHRAEMEVAGKENGEATRYGLLGELTKTSDEASAIADQIVGECRKSEAFAEAGRNNGESFANALMQALRDLSVEAYNTAQEIADMMSAVVSSANINVKVNSYSDAKKYMPTATGGIVTHAQTRLVGEDGAEAIVPLEKNTGWIDNVANKVVSAMGSAKGILSGGNVYNFNQTNNSPKALSRLEIYRQSKRLLKSM